MIYGLVIDRATKSSTIR